MTERGRLQRLVFGEVADDYDRLRPGYPDEIADEIVRVARLAPGDRVLEIGAGTGKATRLLLAKGLDVTALEPDPAMADVHRRRAPGAHVEVVGFEDWPIEPRAFAAVVAAQSWHWVDGRIGPRKAADALRPDGWIALVWNRPDLDGCTWHDELQPIYARIAPGMEHRDERTFASSRERAIAQLERDGNFRDPVERMVPWTARYATEEYVQLLGTHSDKRMLLDEQRSRLFDAIAASLDAAGGVIDHPYVTELVAARVVVH